MIRFAPERPVAAACPSNRLPSLRNWWCHAWKGAWMEHGRMEGRNCISSGFMRPPPVSPFADWLARGCIYPLYIFVRSHLPPVSFAPFFPLYSLSLLLGLRSFVVPITAPAAVAAAAPLCLHVMPPAHSIMAWPNHAARILRASARVSAEY